MSERLPWAMSPMTMLGSRGLAPASLTWPWLSEGHGHCFCCSSAHPGIDLVHASSILVWQLRICGIDANMGLFKLPDAMKARNVQFDLAAHHVEHKKQFRASHDLNHSSSFSAPAGKLKDLFVTDEVLWDSMGLFLIGPNSGSIAQGVARHAFNGDCWPRIIWSKEYNPGYVAKSYKGTLPPHLVEAAASKELL